MIETLMETVVEGFPSLAALVLLAYVFIMKDRQAEQREREREQWFMSILERVLSLKRGSDANGGPEQLD